MNVEGKKIIDPPFALHIASTLEHKTTDLNPLGYDKFSKSKCSVTVGKIPSYEIMCDTHSSYKIVRFKDKNISSLCNKEIIQFIKDYCKTELQKEANKRILKIPIKTIVSSLEPRFGYNLVYRKLKKANLIFSPVILLKFIIKWRI